MKKLIEIQYGFGKIKIPAYIRKDWAVHRHLGIKKNGVRRYLNEGLWVVTHLPTGSRMPHFFPNRASAFTAAKFARRIFNAATPETFYLVADQWFDEMAAAGFRFNPPCWELAS